MDAERVLIIGGSSGLGLEVARMAHGRGASVAIVARDQAKLATAATAIGGRVNTIVAEAHDDGAVERLFSTIDPVDHVVSMVGDSMAGGFLATPPDTMRHVLRSKFWANWTIARFAAPRIRPGGRLTFTTGTGGRPHDISASYVANQGIKALVEGLASELAPDVRVNAVAPTFMGRQTAFWDDVAPEELAAAEASFALAVPLGRLGTVEEVASTYLHVMTNGFITGQVVAVDGGVMLRK